MTLATRVSKLLGIPVEQHVAPSGRLVLRAVVNGVPRSLCIEGRADPVRIAWNWSRPEGGR